MEVTMKKVGDGTADFDLPEGCPLCSSTLFVRMSAQGAASVCPPCRWFSRPHVQWEPGGVRMSHPPAAQA
jgi:hypothetical protein